MIWKSGISSSYDKGYLTKASKLARVPPSLASNRCQGPFSWGKTARVEGGHHVSPAKVTRMHGAKIYSPMCLNCVVLNYAQGQL